jgi:ribosomal protein L11 methyltransferase
MTDIDECAVVASKYNMELNNITNAQVLLKNLLDDNLVKGNIIVCNIMAEVLIAFAPYIGNNLFDKGIIILSGILVERLSAVKDAYLKAGFKFKEEKIKGEWSALVMER